jgi:hypothetical protein
MQDPDVVHAELEAIQAHDRANPIEAPMLERLSQEDNWNAEHR